MTSITLKKEVLKYLKEKGLYQKQHDVLIAELLFQYELLTKAKTDIQQRGIQINVRKNGDEPYYMLNTSVAVINQCTKAIQSLYRQLTIDPASVVKFNKVVDEKDPLSELKELLNS